MAKPQVNGIGSSFHFDDLEEALAAFKQGAMLVVVDDEDRENEGDLIIAASHATTEAMAFIVRHTSGYLCAAMTGRRLDALGLPPMVVNNEDPKQTAYAITADYRNGTSTGISAHDRALTCRKFADESAKAEEFHRPGHMATLRAREGGVLTRTGHTEAAVGTSYDIIASLTHTDLCVLTGLAPVGVLCELLKPDDPEGSVARRDDCRAFADQHGLKMISIEMLVQWRRDHPDAIKP